MIGLKCPKCQTILKIEESMAGSVTTCPGCCGQFRIPQLPRRPSQPTPAAAGKMSPQAKSGTGSQTGIQSKGAKQPADPSIRSTRTPPASPATPEEEEFEYSTEDIEEPEVPAPPPRKRHRVEVEEEEDEEVEEIDEEDEEEEDEDEEDDEDDEDEEEEESPRVRKKKKKGSGGVSAVPFVVGGLILVIVIGCSVGGYFFAYRKGSAPDPTVVMDMIKKRGGNFKQDENDPEKPVIEVSLMGTDADNGDLKMLRAFPKLKKLDLSNCTKINNPGLEWLVDLKQLRVLNCNFCSHVSDGGMEHIGKITSLEELYLNQTIVTDRGLADLRGLKNLKKLGLSGALASGLGLGNALPNVEIIK